MDIKEYIRFLFTQVFNKQKIITKKAESVFDINYKKLKKKGVKLLIFDVDDTLTGHKDIIEKESLELLKKLTKDFRISVLSNCGPSRKKELEKYFKNLKVFVEPTSKKPSRAGFVNIMNHFNILPENTAMIGDKVSMDIWGAYVSGIKERILVEPWSDIFTGLKSNYFLRLIRETEKKFS